MPLHWLDAPTFNRIGPHSKGSWLLPPLKRLLPPIRTGSCLGWREWKEWRQICRFTGD